MTQQPPREPTMEEILASIRRIIAEESPSAKESRKLQPVPAAPLAKTPPAVALPATAMPASPAPREAPLGPPPQQPVAPEGAVLELTEIVEEGPAGEPPALELTDLVEAPPGEAASAPVAASLLTPTVEAEVVGSMASLAAASRPVAAAPVTGGAPLDALVRESLQPALREWLERNLPGLVERLVREELRRLSRRVEES